MKFLKVTGQHSYLAHKTCQSEAPKRKTIVTIKIVIVTRKWNEFQYESLGLQCNQGIIRAATGHSFLSLPRFLSHTFFMCPFIVLSAHVD